MSLSIHSRHSIRDDRSIRSERSYHSTTSSHRSRARPRDIEIDINRDVWNDDQNDDLSIVSRRSESSTKPTDIIIPGEIELKHGTEEEGDDKSIGSLGNQSAASEAYSRGSRNSHRSGTHSISSRNKGNGKTANIIYVENRQSEDRYGEKGVYTGKFSTTTNMPHGKGRMEYDGEGHWYEGGWLHGRYTRRGSYSNANGDFYEGGFKNGQKHGEGIMKYADGSVYTGFWAYGKRNGKGKDVFADGREYEGGFKNDQRHFEGIMKYADGGFYNGSWVNDKRHGKGKEVFVDKEEYEGDFKNDQRHGEGILKYADGSEYVGTFRYGDFQGKGKRTSVDGGEFYNGVYKPSDAGFERASIQKHALRPSADRFFSTLRDYLSCRKAMETAFEKDPDMFTISTIEARSDSGGIEKDDVGGGPPQYKPEFQQQSVVGTPVKSLDDLYNAANTVMPTFRKLVDNIAIKGRDRAQEKATDDYSRREPGPPVSWLYDIVRGSIKFHSAQQIERCIKILLEDDKYFIVKAKNRFMNPTLTGYRDFAVWIQVECEQGFSHVCEIQIHHAGMKQLDSDLGSHKIYEYFRWFFAGAIGSLKDRLKDLEMISEGYQLENFSLDNFIKDCEDEDRLERLALLFHEQMCEFHLALSIYEKLLQLRQAKYETEDHISIAKTYDSQAAVYRDMGQFDKAMELYERCVKMYQGTSEMSLAATYQHMAVIKTETGFPNNALLLYQRSLDILSAMPPDTTNADHVDMSLADIYNNMGNAKRDLGLLDDAIALHEKSLRIKKEYLGMEHSSVATSLNNMGIVRLKQGMVDEAISLFLEAMKVDQRFVGAEHASIAVTQGNLGLAYEQKGELESARDMYDQALKQQRSILGLQHEEVAWTMENLARVRLKERDYDAAIKLLEEAIQIKMELFGDDHAEVATTSKMLDSARRMNSRGDPDGVDTVDDQSLGGSVASSTYGEDRQKVVNKTLLDPYGDKGVYTGVVLRTTGMPHGLGRMVYEEDGRIFEGDWRHGRWHGYGKATFSNGDSYDGEYKFDQRHGKGVYRWADGRVFDGQFSEDKRHGHGVFTWPDGAVYDGEFVNGERQGHGKYQFADGGEYVGSWHGGRYSGFGTCTWEDGRRYRGEWRNGMANGRGTETYPNGTVRHDGQWIDDEPTLDEVEDKKFVEDYQLLQQIGHGEFAEIHIAVHRQSNDVVAVKKVSRRTLAPTDEKALDDEIAVMRAVVDSTHVIRLKAVYEDSDYTHIVMDRVNGTVVIEKLVQKKRFPEDEAKAIIGNLLKGVRHCHDKRIAIRNLKLESLLLPDDDPTNVKITDFECAKVVPFPNALHTQCGTQEYVAPEVLENMPAYDVSCDMWTVGVIVFIMLGGYYPFRGKKEIDVLRKVRNGEFKFHEKYWKGISENAKDLINRLLTTDPEQRITAPDALISKWINSDGSMGSPAQNGLSQPLIVTTMPIKTLKMCKPHISPPRSRS